MARRDPETLVAAALGGDRTAMARAISLVEQGGDAARVVGRLVYPRTGTAYSVGITGAPGAGKSTLTDRLIRCVRDEGLEVGVLAIDPSSPFSGGAFLGDRVRMQDHATDPGTFIRSMASRGHLGGLSLATPEVIRVLDAAGFPWVLVETVGVGQVEFEVAGAADTTMVVLTPGTGDGVQANKAGLLEVADVFVINKADRPGADELHRDLETMLELAEQARPWRPTIVRSVASRGDGVQDVWVAVAGHRAHLESTGELVERRSKRVEEELGEIVVRRLEQRAWEQLTAEGRDALLAAVRERRLDPYAAADAIVGP